LDTSFQSFILITVTLYRTLKGVSLQNAAYDVSGHRCINTLLY